METQRPISSVDMEEEVYYEENMYPDWVLDPNVSWHQHQVPRDGSYGHEGSYPSSCGDQNQSVMGFEAQPYYQYNPYIPSYNHEWGNPSNFQSQYPWQSQGHFQSQIPQHPDFQEQLCFPSQPSYSQQPPMPLQEKPSWEVSMEEMMRTVEETSKKLNEMNLAIFEEPSRNLETQEGLSVERKTLEMSGEKDAILCAPQSHPEMITPQEGSEEGTIAIDPNLVMPSSLDYIVDLVVVDHASVVVVDSLSSPSHASPKLPVLIDLELSEFFDCTTLLLANPSWEGLSDTFSLLDLKLSLNSFDLCKEAQRLALNWYNYP